MHPFPMPCIFYSQEKLVGGINQKLNWQERTEQVNECVARIKSVVTKKSHLYRVQICPLPLCIQSVQTNTARIPAKAPTTIFTSTPMRTTAPLEGAADAGEASVVGLIGEMEEEVSSGGGADADVVGTADVIVGVMD
jgi:hypothetical protein